MTSNRLRQKSKKNNNILIPPDNFNKDNYSKDLFRPFQQAQQSIILLRDSFPNDKALYPDKNIINGPFKALQRINRENSAIKVLPLGNLPWPTKQGTNLTSLALIVKSEQ